MGKPKRFEIIHNESPEGGLLMSALIVLDTMTGVQYLQVTNGNGAGLTPLLDSEGKPIIWDIGRQEDSLF